MPVSCVEQPQRTRGEAGRLRRNCVANFVRNNKKRDSFKDGMALLFKSIDGGDSLHISTLLFVESIVSSVPELSQW